MELDTAVFCLVCVYTQSCRWSKSENVQREVGPVISEMKEENFLLQLHRTWLLVSFASYFSKCEAKKNWPQPECMFA